MWKISALFLVYFFVNVRSLDLRIAGGQDASVNEYPFLAALITNQGQGAYVQKCGGSIISASAILSAASCFYTNGTVNPVTWWRARVGSNNANSGGTIYIIKNITTHENFVPSSLVNNIAVLRTNLDINFQSSLVRAASIAGAGYPYGVLQMVWAAGWGVTSTGAATPSEQLQVVQVWLINQQTCSNRHNEVGFNVTDSMVCAGWLDVGTRGQCQGDVGGPLLDSSGAVIGVFSHAYGCADLYYPDINTRVASYTPWIIAAARA